MEHPLQRPQDTFPDPNSPVPRRGTPTGDGNQGMIREELKSSQTRSWVCSQPYAGPLPVLWGTHGLVMWPGVTCSRIKPSALSLGETLFSSGPFILGSSHPALPTEPPTKPRRKLSDLRWTDTQWQEALFWADRCPLHKGTWTPPWHQSRAVVDTFSPSSWVNSWRERNCKPV